MPHDMNGRPIKAGDRVLVPCEVVSVSEGQQYCNAFLRTARVMAGNGSPISITVNAGQCILDEDPVPSDVPA